MPDDPKLVIDPLARYLDRCARAEAAARKRKDPDDRPRDGWHLREFAGPRQIWIHGDDFTSKGRQEIVTGQPNRGLWRYLVDMDGKRIAEGWAGFLGVAMAVAEEGPLAGMQSEGNA